ncbi:hypothetical protein OG729_00200 [Streptomyces sp. NBC_00210]
MRKAVDSVHEVARSHDISMEPLTEQTIDRVLSDRPTPAHAGQA